MVRRAFCLVNGVVPWRLWVCPLLQMHTCTRVQQKVNGPAVATAPDVCSWQDTVSNNTQSQNDTSISFVSFNFI